MSQTLFCHSSWSQIWTKEEIWNIRLLCSACYDSVVNKVLGIEMYFIRGAESFLRRWSRHYRAFMKLEGSCPCPQAFATSSCPSQINTIHVLHPVSLRPVLMLSCPRRNARVVSFFQVSNQYVGHISHLSLRSTYPAQPVFLFHNLNGFGKEWILLSLSLYNFLRSKIFSSVYLPWEEPFTRLHN